MCRPRCCRVRTAVLYTQASLYGGVGTAAILAACTHLSYKEYKEKKPTPQPVTAVSLGVSAAVTVGMLHGCKAIGENNKLALVGALISTAFTGKRAAQGRSCGTKTLVKDTLSPELSILCLVPLRERVLLASLQTCLGILARSPCTGTSTKTCCEPLHSTAK